MMGSKQRDFLSLVDVSRDHLVPANHFYRCLNRALDLSFVRDLVADHYASGGRPSIDLVVFFKLQLVMLFEGTRSERQLLALAADTTTETRRNAAINVNSSFVAAFPS